MDLVFVELLNRSIAAGWLILAVLVLRLILKKAPKWLTCILWAIVAVRLVSPITLESIFSLIPSAETISPYVVQYAQNPAINSGVPFLNQAVNPMIRESLSPVPGASVNPLYVWMVLAGFLWAIGLLALLAYAVIGYLRMQHKVREAILLQDNIWLCDAVGSPFILGVFRPRIYLPSGIDGEQTASVIAHEQAHLKRLDHLWKMLAYLLLAVYWFQPLLWVSYHLFCRDIELACDEKVIGGLDLDGRKAYSRALVSCSLRCRAIMAGPLAFGEVGVKERVRIVLNYKKPAFWMVTAAVLVCILAAVCFLTDPKELEASQGGAAGAVEEDITWAERPMLKMDGEFYVDPYMPVSELPYGYTLAGTLTEEQAYNTELRGLPYYTNADSAGDFYVFQECGTPVDINTVDSTQLQWAYVRWVRVDNNGIEDRKLTRDDVCWLAQKGDSLEWSDFDPYAYQETGFGLYIRVYEIDQMFYVMVGGTAYPEEPMYFRLCAKDGTDEPWIDIRTDDAEAFFGEHERK